MRQPSGLLKLLLVSESSFVKMMNEKAEEIGLKDYKFVNSTGLNNHDLKGMHVAGDAEEENIMSRVQLQNLLTTY